MTSLNKYTQVSDIGPSCFIRKQIGSFETCLQYSFSGYGDMFSNILVLACANCQVVRRLLECIFVSVYSPDSKMSFVIYFIGIAFYAALPVTALSGTDIDSIFKCEGRVCGIIYLFLIFCYHFSSVIFHLHGLHSLKKINLRVLKTVKYLCRLLNGILFKHVMHFFMHLNFYRHARFLAKWLLVKHVSVSFVFFLFLCPSASADKFISAMHW